MNNGIFFMQDELILRRMTLDDAEAICREETSKGWHVTKDKYISRISDMESGNSYAIVAEYKGQVAGYINLLFKAVDGPFKDKFPEVYDFGVFEQFRGQGIGSMMMDTVETLAAELSDTICLGVGMHSGYGSAQRMYVKRGYVPDGSGVWYQNKICGQYEPCCNDDDLVLFFSKKIRG